MNSIPTDVGKLILNELPPNDLVRFLKTSKTNRDTYLRSFMSQVERAIPKYGKFKNKSTSLKFGLNSLEEYEDFDSNESATYANMQALNSSMPEYREILTTLVPFSIRAFNGTGFHYQDFTYKLYAYKTLIAREEIGDRNYKFNYTPQAEHYMFEGKDIDIYFFNEAIETGTIDSCDIVFGIK